MIRAPENYWKKYDEDISIITVEGEPTRPNSNKAKKKARINKTVSKTFFGNSDIAIKMDSPGTFIVKGARVDSDEALKTSFKVLNQGIKYMAYANGIPTPTGGNGSEKSNNIQIPELEEYNHLSRKLEEIINQSDLFTDAYVQSLIFEMEKMEAGDTTAVVRIKKSLEAYEKLIKTTK